MRKQIIVISLFLVLIAGMAVYGFWFYFYKPPPTPEANPLLISGPTWVEVGKEATFIVTSLNQPVEGATIEVAGRSRVTGADGTISFMFNETGNYEVYARKEGYRGSPQVLYQDDFSSQEKWFVHKDGLLAVDGWSLENEDGNAFLHITGDNLDISPRQDLIDNTCLAWANYTVKVKFRAPETGFEVIFRFTARGDYDVVVNANGDGTYLIDLIKLVPIVNYTESYNYDKGKVLEDWFEVEKNGNSWHEMEITALGKNITIIFDNKLSLNWTDNDVDPSRRPYLEGGVYFGGAPDIDDVVIKLVSRDESAASMAIKVYPNGNEQISLRGAKEGKPDAWTRSADLREIGANLIPFNKDYYVNMTMGSIESLLAWEPVIARVRSAHSRGLEVHFTPYLWRGNEIELGAAKGSLPIEEFLKNAAAITLDCARFADNNGIEIFQPANVNEFVPQDIADEWYQLIIPKIKEVYNGSIILGLIYISEGEEEPTKMEFNYSSYDYISLIPRFPSWKLLDVGKLKPIYDTYREWLRKTIEVGLIWSEKYGTKGLYVPFIATDFVEEFVRAEMKNGLTMGQIRAKVLDIFFQETVGHLKGCIVDSWQESLTQKCFTIRDSLSAAMSGKGVTHTQANLWGYQGPEVEELVKKYYISGN